DGQVGAGDARRIAAVRFEFVFPGLVPAGGSASGLASPGAGTGARTAFGPGAPGPFRHHRASLPPQCPRLARIPHDQAERDGISAALPDHGSAVPVNHHSLLATASHMPRLARATVVGRSICATCPVLGSTSSRPLGSEVAVRGALRTLTRRSRS